MVTDLRRAVEADAIENLPTQLRALASLVETAIAQRAEAGQDIYPVSEAAEKLRVSSDWLRDQMRREQVPHYHYAGQYFMSSAQIAWFLDQRRKGDY